MSEAETKVEVTDDVVERLRKSQKEHDAAVYAAGRKSGEQWAKNLASVGELNRLESFVTADDVFDPFDCSFNFAEAIAGDPAFGKDDASRFWRNAVRDETLEPVFQEPEFLEGFTEGALDVWNAVREKLYPAKPESRA